MAEAIGESEDSIEVYMPDYTKKGWKNTEYGQELYFPTWKMPEDHVIVTSGVDAYKDLYGKDPVVDKWTFSTNGVATTGRHKIPAIGFGPGDEDQAHAPNEINRVADLEICSAFTPCSLIRLRKTIVSHSGIMLSGNPVFRFP